MTNKTVTFLKLCVSTDNINRVKRQPTEWENIHKSDKGLIFRLIYLCCSTAETNTTLESNYPLKIQNVSEIPETQQQKNKFNSKMEEVLERTFPRRRYTND